jgi:arylsulfatase A
MEADKTIQEVLFPNLQSFKETHSLSFWDRTSALRLFITAAALPLAAHSYGKPANLPRKPNIIYILADDLGYGDLGCYGQQKIKTPNLDRMASEGMLFTQHYAGTAVSAPSRCSLLTGMHTGHTIIRGNANVSLSEQEVTLAKCLKDAGYTTGAFGKWGLGNTGSTGEPDKQGFDEFFGYIDQTLAHNYYPYFLMHNNDTVMLPGNKGKGREQYSHDLIQAAAIKFIETSKEKPFFIYLPYTLPHAEMLAPDDSILNLYRGKFPETAFAGVDSGPKFRKGPYASQPAPKAAYAAMISRLDYSVGQVLKRIKELGLDDNTIVMFSSDNGPHKEGGAEPDFFDSNASFRGYKRDLYEGGIREPFIVRWPGKVKAGTKSDLISAFWDIMPTVNEIGGAQTPSNTDGLSIAPTLLGIGTQRQHDYLYWEFHEQGGKKAVRKGKWKAVQVKVSQIPAPRLELYDLSLDPGETNNVAVANPEIVKEMELIMKTARTDSKYFYFSNAPKVTSE